MNKLENISSVAIYNYHVTYGRYIQPNINIGFSDNDIFIV